MQALDLWHKDHMQSDCPKKHKQKKQQALKAAWKASAPSSNEPQTKQLVERHGIGARSVASGGFLTGQPPTKIHPNFCPQPVPTTKMVQLPLSLKAMV